MSKSIKKVAGIAAPFVSLIPGIGLPAAIALGAGLGGISGGLKGALAGGLGAGALGGGGSILGKALGASGTAANALGTGILGAGAGAATNGLKGALIGGATGAIGGGLGTAASKPLAAGISGPSSPGTGILGSLSGLGSGGSSLARGIGSVVGSAKGLGSGGGSSAYSPLTSVASGLIGTDTNDDAEKALLKQQQKALGLYTPYLNAKFEPGDLTQDPGYQFRLSQGNQALDRQQSAKGNYFSGEALKSAQDYGQGLADSTYSDAYNRWLAQNGQNLQAAGSAAGIYDNIGNIQGNAITNNGNVLTQSIAGLTGGQAANNTGALMGGMSPELSAYLASLSPEQRAQYYASGRA